MRNVPMLWVQIKFCAISPGYSSTAAVSSSKPSFSAALRLGRKAALLAVSHTRARRYIGYIKHTLVCFSTAWHVKFWSIINHRPSMDLLKQQLSISARAIVSLRASWLPGENLTEAGTSESSSGPQKTYWVIRWFNSQFSERTWSWALSKWWLVPTSCVLQVLLS